MESGNPKVTNYNHKAPGRSKASAACKKHPRHRQSPGVCSICLSEKLSQLSNSCSKAARSPPSSSSSSYVSSLSSSDASSCSSPVVTYTCHVDSEAGTKPVRVFKKSRSMAFVSSRRKDEDDGNGNRKKIGGIKGGFLAKLLPRKSRKLLHSRTMVERVITAVH